LYENGRGSGEQGIDADGFGRVTRPNRRRARYPDVAMRASGFGGRRGRCRRRSRPARRHLRCADATIAPLRVGRRPQELDGFTSIGKFINIRRPMEQYGVSRVGPAQTRRMFMPIARNSHLARLEAESISIIREVAAEFRNPVMLYSIGKDSSVMLHLAMKAFHPSKPPFPLMHVNTTWKFREMITFRDETVKRLGLDLIEHVNEDGVRAGITPFTHGSSTYTHVMKTEALKQALTKYGFDAAFGGARRDEEKSRAKERIFSFRTASHAWDPKNQRPELWRLYNARVAPGESIRAFPLSNWTELDIWQYILAENIPIVPLYYAAMRPVVERGGMMLMVDDDRLPLEPGETPEMRLVRFRTLGCYPLTGAIDSPATTLTEIVREMLIARTSERQGRLIDHDEAGSMEKKKREGYF
jgi:sulfate adenylyltransferase subunit 2